MGCQILRTFETYCQIALWKVCTNLQSCQQYIKVSIFMVLHLINYKHSGKLENRLKFSQNASGSFLSNWHISVASQKCSSSFSLVFMKLNCDP